MAVMIKDMDMPVDCLGCRISCKHESHLAPGRPDGCPLAEVTGDIISRDAVKEKACKFFGHDVIFLNRIDAIPNARLTHDLTHACVDLISRADAIEAVHDACNYCDTCDIKDIGCSQINALSALPSAEAVQGEWIKTVGGNGWNEWYVFKCPFCGATIEDKHYHSWKYNFCPNCGARMYKGGGE